MAKSRNRKNHKKKVAARNQRLKNQKRNYQRKMLEAFIKQEQEQGKFNDIGEIDDQIAGPEI